MIKKENIRRIKRKKRKKKRKNLPVKISFEAGSFAENLHEAACELEKKEKNRID